MTVNVAPTRNLMVIRSFRIRIANPAKKKGSILERGMTTTASVILKELLKKSEPAKFATPAPLAKATTSPLNSWLWKH